MKTRLTFCILALSLFAVALAAQALPQVDGVELQPLSAQVRRLIDAMEYLGEPFSVEDLKAHHTAMAAERAEDGAKAIQEILDARCLFGVNINPEMRVKVMQGLAKPVLVEKGWKQFLVKVANEAGTTIRRTSWAFSPACPPHGIYVATGLAHAPGATPFALGEGWPEPSYRAESFPRTEDLIHRFIAIPIGVLHTEADIDYIACVIRHVHAELGLAEPVRLCRGLTQNTSR